MRSKDSCPVLRGLGDSNVSRLPDSALEQEHLRVFLLDTPFRIMMRFRMQRDCHALTTIVVLANFLKWVSAVKGNSGVQFRNLRLRAFDPAATKP